MDLRIGERTFRPGQFALLTEGPDSGADLVVLAPDPELIRAVCAEPGPPVATEPTSATQAADCVRAGAALLLGDSWAAVAAATGSALACTDPLSAAGLRPDGVLVTAADLRSAERHAAEGWPLLAPDEEPALVSVYAWLGARVFRTTNPPATRQVLDMVAAIRGTRPPAVARRGLA